MPFSRFYPGILALFILISLQSCSGREGKPLVLTISAASSLKDSMESIKTAYVHKQPDISIQLNFGSSGTLQQQIMQGADVDMFISAADKQMNELEKGQFLLDGTRVELLGNRVALITAVDMTAISDFKDLTGAGVTKIAIGDPKSVPAGQYAQEVLTNMNLYEELKPKLVFANDVRQVLIWVETGDAGAGVVYETDAAISDKVKIAAVAPENTHAPVVYPAAIIKTCKNIDAAKGFMEFLVNEESRKIFEGYGFSFIGKMQGGG